MAAMDFMTAVKTCFSRYVDFNGRAARPEFWWFALFCFIGGVVLGQVNHLLSTLFSLGTLLPSLAVGARRLHDMDKSGWWQLLWLLPIIGWIVMIIMMAQPGTAGANRFGDGAAGEAAVQTGAWNQ
jgi:uncharacterized membrane protein YhaH (DUF805 family)